MIARQAPRNSILRRRVITPAVRQGRAAQQHGYDHSVGGDTITRNDSSRYIRRASPTAAPTQCRTKSPPRCGRGVGTEIR